MLTVTRDEEDLRRYSRHKVMQELGIALASFLDENVNKPFVIRWNAGLLPALGDVERFGRRVMIEAVTEGYEKLE